MTAATDAWWELGTDYQSRQAAVRAVQCPHCHAEPGVSCTTPNGWAALHKVRINAAAGRLPGTDEGNVGPSRVGKSMTKRRSVMPGYERLAETAADYLRGLVEGAADSPASGRWTAHHGIGGWYVEDGNGRIVCTTDDASVAAFIAANSPAAVAKLTLRAAAVPPAQCEAETRSWDHFTPEQMDSYWIRCTLSDPHQDHEDEHTGLTWKDTTGPR